MKTILITDQVLSILQNLGYFYLLKTVSTDLNGGPIWKPSKTIVENAYVGSVKNAIEYPDEGFGFGGSILLVDRLEEVFTSLN